MKFGVYGRRWGDEWSASTGGGFERTSGRGGGVSLVRADGGQVAIGVDGKAARGLSSEFG